MGGSQGIQPTEGGVGALPSDSASGRLSREGGAGAQGRPLKYRIFFSTFLILFP